MSTAKRYYIYQFAYTYRYWYNRELGLDYYKSDIMELYGYGHVITNPLIRQWYDDVYNKRKLSYAKSQYHWLNDKKIDSLSCNSAYLNHKQAWTNYNSHLQRMPRFHSKKKQGYNWRYQTSCMYRKNKAGEHIGSVRIIDSRHVILPKLGKVRTSRIRNLILNKLDIRIGRVTITKDNLDQFYVSFQLGSMTPFVYLPKRTNQLSALGYDLNTSNFLMSSHGDYVANPRYYKRCEAKCKWLSHCLSRKQRHNHSRRLRDCENYQRNRLAVAHLKKHVKYQRYNFLQQLSTKLIEKQDFLAGENLKSSNMLKNHRIAKSIQSVGWREFINMLSYKAVLYHKIYVLVNPAYTTQMCSNCGYVCNKQDGTYLTLKDREWTCPKCKVYHIRDINASINILNKAITKVLPYIPKTVRSSVRKATQGRKQAQCSHRRLLEYLVNHFYGVTDTAGRVQSKLIRED